MKSDKFLNTVLGTLCFIAVAFLFLMSGLTWTAIYDSGPLNQSGVKLVSITGPEFQRPEGFPHIVLISEKKNPL